MVKMVSLSDKAYEALKAKKHGKESFSDVVLKTIGKDAGKKSDLSEFFGAWKMTDEEFNEFNKVLERHRGEKSFGRYRF